MAWKVVGKRMLLCAVVQKCAAQGRFAKAHYTMMPPGTPTSALTPFDREKTARPQEKNLRASPVFCYPESNVISLRPMMGWLVSRCSKITVTLK
jgi:hypothetical protein